MTLQVGDGRDSVPRLTLLSRKERPSSRRARRRARAQVLSLGSVLIVVGVALFLAPLVWRAQAWWFQRGLAREAGDPVHEEEHENPVMEALPGPTRPATEEAPPTVGSRPDLFRPFRIIIPGVEVDAWVVLDTTLEVLRQGPGLYLEGVYPGGKGNCAIAAHRTGYGGWFRHLDRLRPGDLILLQVGESVLTYAVDKVFITEPTDWGVLEPTPEPVLTLTTCDPPGTSKRRLVVRASLVELDGPEQH